MASNCDLLKDKVCLVTGATRGIGRAVVERFADCGAVVYANGRKEEALKELAGAYEKKTQTEYQSGKIIPVCFDVTDSDAARKAVMQIKKEQGRLDVLVNNAGVMKDALIGMVSKEDMRKTFEVNVFAVMDMLQLAVKVMARQNSGSIINLASIVGTNGNKGQLVYSASKGAVISLTKTASKELAPKNIRVNAVAPGIIDTDMFHSIGEEKMQEKLKLIGMNRPGTPEEVADACIYLASDLSKYVTGQILGVDGCEVI
jgi:3-oxoacyl-[acyl-carrier protein] reductase